MPLPNTLPHREYEKFGTDSQGNTIVKTTAEILSLLAPPANSDSFLFSFPSPTVEVVTFYSGGLGGNVVRTITMTYTNASKKVLLSGVAV